MTRTASDRSTPPNPLYAYVGAFVSELRRAGIAHVVICPGSRSTPLALACAEEKGLRVWMHLDERAAAFFALGMAKRLASPVALLCTSGTAAANFFPAIIEAKLTRVPLVVLTADRPHELRDCGAPQTIDQNRLYGVYVKWFMDVALPEATTTALRYIRTLANRAVALARARPAGPVHLNLPFREPLTPEPQPQLLPPATEREPLAWAGRAEQAPYVRVTEAEGAGLPTATVARLAALLRQYRRGLIIVGPQSEPRLAPALQRLAERCGYPLLADPLSQVRSSGQSTGLVLRSYDAFLRSERFVASAAPDLVLRFGAIPTSKPLLLYLQRYGDRPLLVVDGAGGWEEPTQLAGEMLHADPVAVCEQLVEALAETSDAEEHHEPWLERWQQAERLTQQALRRTMETFSQLFEGRVFSELAELLPDGSTLYVGNSMPVRDLDTFFWSERPIRCLGNRGANGIDGVLSSALGVSAAQQALADPAPVVLVIGDLAFLHDLNGLIAAHLHQLPLLVILINNDGGGIFSFLPQAAYPEHFEQLFGTPTGLNFAPAVEMYRGRFRRISSWEEFRSACREGLSQGGLQVIEVVTERVSNVELHRQLWRAVDQALCREASEEV
ncbi:2-succinyl-5-enolpyruvyl-6-hydroxy-3-cyclohexene- 1-carboxylate synthase [Thermogemmatispora aurantia]|uniref:2-succinyl-5-enolpyruvyl-6-hydroxy-3- cyclohexene-1-carboxylic-acid synthase n=1 Tax=Thermogemmatispora aurantia TaxID=2045279 RepID=UPI00124E9549|nr:2-succinyl-5-enolpyruvyl-6-hydroxy-3-cyclohexene-1-carboxylic-acid synthase [Thermogemmatispora aurantia]GER85451.1 2-succinyl-5-enolpyruvyl-6-hydroxy-3-cyclohexene- 1-carboxylate synthase [Thermogemmatispora aurantia]